MTFIYEEDPIDLSEASKASSSFLAFDFKSPSPFLFGRNAHLLTLFSLSLQSSEPNPLIDSNVTLIKALARLCEYSPTKAQIPSGERKGSKCTVCLDNQGQSGNC